MKQCLYHQYYQLVVVSVIVIITTIIIITITTTINTTTTTTTTTIYTHTTTTNTTTTGIGIIITPTLPPYTTLPYNILSIIVESKTQLMSSMKFVGIDDNIIISDSTKKLIPVGKCSVV